MFCSRSASRDLPIAVAVSALLAMYLRGLNGSFFGSANGSTVNGVVVSCAEIAVAASRSIQGWERRECAVRDDIFA